MCIICGVCVCLCTYTYTDSIGHTHEGSNFLYQESIPNATAEKVKEAMLEGVEKALGLSKRSLQKPFYTRLQLWYEVMLNNLINVC